MKFIDLINFLKYCSKELRNKLYIVIYLIKSTRHTVLEYISNKERCLYLKELMTKANSYDEWKNYAIELDELQNKFKWKNKKETSIYNYTRVEELILSLKFKRENKETKGLIHTIRANLIRNILNTSNSKLYEIANVGTKHQIQIFHDELIKCLEHIYLSNEINLNSKIEFFSEARHNYGRTALLLSGGATLGMYHNGVIKALYDNNLIPNIICGSSAGSIVAGIICTNRHEDIPKLFSRGLKLGPFQYKDNKYSFARRILRFLFTGVLMDSEIFYEFLRENIGDFTFQEAYDRTGFILNVTVTDYNDENNILLNYLSAPNVLVWSAVAASCSVPSLFKPVVLLCKNEHGAIIPYNSGRSKYIDGSISFDLPMQRLAELFNVNNFIVSQTNPHVIPFLSNDTSTMHSSHISESKKISFFSTLKNFIYNELKLRLIQLNELGILPSPVEFFLRLFKQQYHGDVTIYPVPSLKDFLKVLKNPTKEMIEECTIQSERITYSEIHKIESLTKVEYTLDRLYYKLKYKQKKSKFNGDNKYKKYYNDDSKYYNKLKYLNRNNNTSLCKFGNLNSLNKLNINYDNVFDDIEECYNSLLFNNSSLNNINSYSEVCYYVSNEKKLLKCCLDNNNINNNTKTKQYNMSNKSVIQFSNKRIKKGYSIFEDDLTISNTHNNLVNGISEFNDNGINANINELYSKNYKKNKLESNYNINDFVTNIDIRKESFNLPRNDSIN